MCLRTTPSGLAAIVSIALLSLPACVTPGGTRGDYFELYDQGVQEFRLERFADAKATFERLLQEHPDHPFNEYVKLRLAACDFSLGHVEEARATYEGFIDSLGDLRIQALEDLGNLEMLAGNYDVAAQRLRDAARQARDAATRTRIEYRLALCLQQGGHFADARTAFEKIAGEAPGSEWAESARRRMTFPDFFTVQAGAYGRRSSAEARARTLGRAGFSAAVHPLEEPGRTLYRVWVGRFSDRAEAERLRKRILARGISSESELLVIP